MAPTFLYFGWPNFMSMTFWFLKHLKSPSAKTQIKNMKVLPRFHFFRKTNWKTAKFWSKVHKFISQGSHDAMSRFSKLYAHCVLFLEHKKLPWWKECATSKKFYVHLLIRLPNGSHIFIFYFTELYTHGFLVTEGFQIPIGQNSNKEDALL